MRKSHGKSGTRLYRIWARIKCEEKNYPWSDGRYTVCEEWARSFNAFELWSYANGYTENKKLYRDNRLKGHNPDNSYWATSRRAKAHIVYSNGEYSTADNIINHTFGKLTVLREVPKEMRKPGRRTFVCKCECGNEVNVLAQNLLSGATKSCGCARNRASKITTTDTGNIRAGRLTILERFDDNGVVKYRCLCDCGKMLGVPAADLFSGRVTSCGCSVTQVQQPTPASEPNPLVNWDNF